VSYVVDPRVAASIEAVLQKATLIQRAHLRGKEAVLHVVGQEIDPSSRDLSLGLHPRETAYTRASCRSASHASGAGWPIHGEGMCGGAIVGLSCSCCWQCCGR
jgi:hypothetical protein